MSIHTRLASAAAKNGFSTDLPWEHAFPAGSNIEPLIEDGIPTTRRMLGFHLRRALLSLIHEAIRRYAAGSSSLSRKVIAKLLEAIWERAGSTEFYGAKPASIEDLLRLDTSKGPTHIATSLKLVSPAPDGDLSENEVLLQAIDELVDRVADVASWAALSKCVTRLTIYENSGALRIVDRERIQTAVDARIKSAGYLGRGVDVSFLDEYKAAPPGKLAVLLVSDVLHGSCCCEKFGALTPATIGPHLLGCADLPDLFIAFNGQSNGFPLPALYKATVFTPQREEVLLDDKPLLQDYIRAFSTYLDEDHQP